MPTVTASSGALTLTSRRTGSSWSEAATTAGMALSGTIPVNATVTAATLVAKITQTPMSGAYLYLNGTAVRTTHGEHAVTVTVSPGADSYAVACAFRGGGTDNTVSIVTFELTLTVAYEAETRPASGLALSAETVAAGGSFTAIITPGKSTYGHQVLFDFGGYQTASAVLEPGVTQVALTAPIGWLAAMTDSASGVGTVTLRCWEGSKTSFFGAVTKPLTVTAPASAGPEVGTVSVAPLLTVDGVTYPEVVSGAYVQGKSGYSAAISGASAKYGARIAAYSISGGGYSGRGATLKSGLLGAAGTQKITFRVTDTRGLSATKTVNITVLAYTPPRVTELTAWRVNETGEADGAGTLGKTRWADAYSALGGKNTLTANMYIKPVGGTETALGALDGGDGAYWLAGTGGAKIALEVTKRYVLRRVLTDAYGAVERSMELPSANFAIHLNAKGNGICFGGASTAERAVEIAPEYDLAFKGKRYTRMPTALDGYPVGAIYLSTVATSPAELFGGTWKRLEGRFLLGCSADYPAGTAGGAAKVTLTVAQMPTHAHQFSRIPIVSNELTAGGNYYAEKSTAVGKLVAQNTETAGGGKAHTNMPPYLAVYAWERIA